MPQALIKNDHHEDYIYVFESQSLNAIKAAVLINRPLLVKGKPGSGKSQLAKAAASYLKRAFVPYVVTAKTESQNLLWSFDAVARLADAQIEGALCEASERNTVREKLALKNYIKPEALWIALNWSSAQQQFDVLARRQGQDPQSKNYQSPLTHYEKHEYAESSGAVILIDEIDKADSSLPNGLLEVLGSNRFQPEGLDQPVELVAGEDKPQPLIIITTNDEHPLPDAFVRRCLVVEVGMPEEEEKQKNYLVEHAQPNFEDLEKVHVTGADGEKQNVLEAIADQVIADRRNAKRQQVKPLVGQAEYFDLLRGVKTYVKDNGEEGLGDVIKTLACFSSQKGQDSPKVGIDLPAMGNESNGS